MTMRQMIKRLAEADRSRGAAAVEFAIVLPVLIILVFGIIDFGRYFSMQQTMEQLARQGARLVALGDATSDVQLRINAAATAAGLNTSRLTISTPATCPAGQNAQNALVTVKYSMSGLILLAKSHPTGIGQMQCGG
jgi:Flp pilus assembly protein TadG